MFNRVIFVILILISCTSCTYFSSESKSEAKALDTIINFTKVDVSPSFKVCDKLLDQAKTNCFRININKQITKHLQKIPFVFEDTIEEAIIKVILNIDNKGEITLKRIDAPAIFTKANEILEEEIITAIRKLPKLSPAIKRGIPVATEYTLPIKIRVAE